MVTPGRTTPGRVQPGLRTPGFSVPGNEIPGGARLSAFDDVVAVDAAGTTVLGTVSGDRGELVDVTVDSDVADFAYNILADGDVVTTESGSLTAVGDTEFAIEITDPSATAGATATVAISANATDQ